MALAGEQAGLPTDLALQLARETVAGAGVLMVEGSDNPSRLRENVTSPGGTTAAALSVLMADGGLCDLMNSAINAAKRRSEELSA